ncbi:PEP/pyruvate-binding domain-containing protein [Pseudonocardia charpentierae]|uniref:PEP/pyruvate-binding domain-containing protein n=1 Tax=Pseudonocardia charpentierae TaxID=3075545 RepID=A0ABU2NA54_9PSEU|nr:PEP/pyruvate-binding domain-containing protein [Pseudonocardia sp. DSM 45834]MDT0350764.1 PEP/pyruvate-binding domain-containing protein [Pseudonocardia sp. DSM 45834]
MLPLADVTDPMAFGGKAVALGSAIRAGLPVPDGVALSVDTVEAVVRADPDVVPALHRVCSAGGPRAVRSSAVGEDSAGASFAGAHCTVLGVCDPEAVVAAVRRVHASADAPQARAYRAQLGLGPARMGVVVQELVPADVAGVLFTRNPVTGAAERVIEASWGLGEAVVAGLVVPDRYRLDVRGRVLERVTGEKDVAVRAGPGGAREIAVDDAEVHAPCLDDAQLAKLHALAEACDAVYGTGDHDIEFAFHAGAVFLLQRRPITGG